MTAPITRLFTPRSKGSQLAEMLALGALLAITWRACGSRHRHRLTSRSARLPEDMHTWEGEGGRPLSVDHVARP